MALVIVAVLAVVVGIAMPGSGHVERSLVIGKDIRQVYDVLNNFRRFPDYSELTTADPTIKYQLSGKAYGPGAEISWTGSAKKAGDGKLTVASAEPGFDKIDASVNNAKIVWNLDGDWRGADKHFTLDLSREGRTHKLTRVTWAYDVQYGWNLINRYSNLYIHGDPDAFIEYSLGSLQNMMASVKNVDYSDLIPYIVQTKPTPVLMVSTKIERSGGLDALNETTNDATKLLQETAKKLGVNVTGPRILVVNNYGDQTFTFDVALPIDSTSITIGGQSHDLTAAAQPALQNGLATAASTATAASAAAPASASSAPSDVAANTPGSNDKYGRLIIDQDVRATMIPGGPALKGEWNGTYAGVPQTRDELEAYAQTHGYKYDTVVNRFYDILARPEQIDTNNNITQYARFDVYLPLSDAPEQTPEQEAGMQPPSLDAPASSGSSAAPAASSSAASN
jgi:hypothetical protein